MCKLAAFIDMEEKQLPSATQLAVTKTLKHLFYINSFGQTDGSGVMIMDSTGDTRTHKRALPSPDFMNTGWFNLNVKDLCNTKFIGMHTRFSTVGTNSDMNSHPFVNGDIVFMQNGTIDTYCNHRSLVKGLPNDCTVDSDAVGWAIDKQGLGETLKEYIGAGVFMWLNTKELTFNIVKNGDRELHIMKVAKHDAYIVATDKHALYLAAERSGLAYDSVAPVTNDVHHVWTITNEYKSSNAVIDNYAYGTFGKHHFNAKSAAVTTPAVVSPMGKSHGLVEIDTGTKVCTCTNCFADIYDNEVYHELDWNGDKATSCEDCVDILEELLETKAVTVVPEQSYTPWFRLDEEERYYNYM